MATTTSTPVDTLNSLLRGEMSAVETYRQAEEKFQGQPQAAELRRIGAEHREAVNTLRPHVTRHGGQPSESSGVWGQFATLVEGAAKLFGSTAALKALKEGEEHGIKDFQDALKDNTLPPDCRQLIQGTLMPRCQEHIRTLDQLMASV